MDTSVENTQKQNKNPITEFQKSFNSIAKKLKQEQVNIAKRLKQEQEKAAKKLKQDQEKAAKKLKQEQATASSDLAKSHKIAAAELLKSHKKTLSVIIKFIEMEKMASQMEQKITDMKEIDKQKSEFSAMISHELKTPLSTIIGYSDILKNPKMGKLTKDQKFAIDEIYSSSLSLEKLIENVLTVQKLELNQLNIKRQKISVKELIKQAYNRLLPIMSEKQIEFLTSAEEDLTINIDKERMMEVFSNLVQNSVDFVPASGGRIEIASRSENSNVLFSVIDNGIGIPKDKLGNLFTKYYQIDTSITRKHGGSGLGLVICKGVVERFGGKIWIESEEGKGTTAYFTVPKA